MFRIVGDDAHNIRVIEEALDRKFEEKCTIVRAEAELAAERIRDEGFGPDTDQPLSALRIRSGDAVRTIGSTFEKTNALCIAKVGSIDPDPKVRRYLEVHDPPDRRPETVIFPAFAPKLAFPPSKAGYPARDSRGVQLLTLAMFRRLYKSLGFAWYTVAPDAVYARRRGSRQLERIFIRREYVVVPARRPIRNQIKPTLRRLREALKVEEQDNGQTLY